MADALIGIGADLSALRESLQDIPGLAGKEADAAIRKIQRLSIQASKGVSKAIRQQARENDRAQKAAERAARAAAREAEKQADEAREAAKGLAELAGVSADRFDKLRAVFKGLQTPLGAMAVGGTAIGLAFVGAAAAIVGAGVAVVDLTRSARDLLDEVEPLQDALGISPATVDRIHAANDALDAAAAAGKALAIRMADELAPAVERVAVVALKMGLMTVDALNEMGTGADAVARVFYETGKVILGALAPPLQTLLQLVDTVETVARAAGFDALADSIQSVRRSVTGIPLDIAAAGFERIEVATGDYDDQARALIGTITSLRIAEQKRNDTQQDAPKGDSEREAAEAAREAARALGIYTKALEAAQRPFVDQSEIAQLRRLQQALVEAAANTTLTAAQTEELSAALSQLSSRITEIETEPLRELDASMQDAIAAFESMSIDVDLDVRKETRQALFARAKEIGQGAANVIGTLTGGALSSLASPAALLEAAQGGAKAGRQMAEQAVDFIEGLAKNLGPFLQALADGIPDIIVALAKAAPQILVALVKSADDIAIGIVKGVAEGVVVLVRTLGRTIRRVVRQALGLDGSDRRQERRQERRDSMRRRFSDTPGMQRLQRETAMTFAAGDRVIAARSDAGLRAQMGGGSGPLSVTTVLDVRDGPVRLGMAVAANREIRRSGIGTDSTGRGRVY